MFRSWRQSVRELGERVERLEGELGRLNMENADLKSQLISSFVRALISAFKARRELALDNVALR